MQALLPASGGLTRFSGIWARCYAQANFPLGELTCLTTLAEHSCGVTSLAFDRGTLYSGGHDGNTKVVQAAVCATDTWPDDLTRYCRRPRLACFQRQVWDLATSTVKRTLTGHQYTVWSLATDALNDRLYSASADSTIKAWNTESGATTCERTIQAHSGRVYSLVIHDNRLFSASSDRTIKVNPSSDCRFTT